MNDVAQVQLAAHRLVDAFSRNDRGPLGKRKLSHAKTVFCTKRYRLYVMSGIFRIPA